MKCSNATDIIDLVLIPISVKVKICPTKPQVPIPAPADVFVVFKIQVAIGAMMIEDNVGGKRIQGFFNILGN